MPDQKAHTTERYTSSKVIFLQDVTLSALASLLSILLIRWISEPIPGFTAIVVKWLLGALVGSIIGLLLSGLTLIVRRYLSYGIVSKLATAVLVKEVALVLTAIFLIKFPSAALAVTALVVDVLLTAIALAWPRYASMILRKEERAITNLSAKKTALIFGTSKESVRLAEDSEQSGRYTVLGFLSDDPSLAGRVISDRIVYGLSSPTDMEALQWRLGGVDCVLFPKGKPQSEENAKSETGVSEIPSRDGMSLVGHAFKRSFDILLSGALLIVFSPLIAICALAIKLEDGDPVIYRQERIGRGGKVFNILKFRSMRKDAEKNGCPALYSGDDDPRLTKVGKFLRQHHLDELPQLWNVFKGDMSFIGYRPERQYYIDQIMARNPRYRYLYQIRPGVTSYATLYNGYTDTLDKMLTRLDLDLYYLRNHSIWFDAKVLGLTFLSIISGRKF